jgi:uncharacterized protein (UPF0332 family)
MNRGLVLAEWRRAKQSLRAAQVLVDEDCPEDAVSRAYYAILHGAKAALHVRDVAVASHAGARRMFGLHLVRTGDIEPEWAAYLGESLDDRLAADYESGISVSTDEARRETHRARRFLGRIRRYLRASGLTVGELR